MVIDFYNRNGGGGGTADYATLAGESDKSKLLEGASAPPQSANTGDVVAIAPNPTRGLRSARTLGIYQYDGTNWNKIEGESSSAYKIELLEVNPELYTERDIASLNAFYAAFTADTSIADSAYIYAVDGIYRCVRYIAIPNSPIFTFEGTYNNNIVDIWLHFSDGRFSYGSLQDAVPTPKIPDTTSLKPTTELPEDPEDGEIALLSEEAFIDYKPEAPNGQTVYGGGLEEFMVAIKGTSNNELWVSTWDDANHTERTDQGYFHLESDAIDYYDYQGDMDYLFNDLNEGEWVDVNTICLWKEGKNLYFYVKQEAEGVFFRETDSTMEFETVVTDNTLNQYDGGDWKIFPQVLYSRGEFPKVVALGDVVALVEETEGLPYGITFEERNDLGENQDLSGGRFVIPKNFGYGELSQGDLVFIGKVGLEGGSLYDMNIEYLDGYGAYLTYEDPTDPLLSIDMDDRGDNLGNYDYLNEIVFFLNADENNYILDIYPYTENSNVTAVAFSDIPEVSEQAGLFQYDGEDWNRAVTSNSINSIVKLTQAEYDALVSGGTVDANTFYVIISPNS